MLDYFGSTVPGCSGAPYMVGNTVLGMHLSGGIQNQGVSLDFVRVLVSSPESSEEFLRKQIKRGRKVKVARIPGQFADGRRVVFVGGKFHVMDGDLDIFDELDEDEMDDVLRMDLPAAKKRFGFARNVLDPNAAPFVPRNYESAIYPYQDEAPSGPQDHFRQMRRNPVPAKSSSVNVRGESPSPSVRPPSRRRRPSRKYRKSSEQEKTSNGPTPQPEQ